MQCTCTNGRQPLIRQSSVVPIRLLPDPFSVTERFELPIRQSIHQSQRFQLHSDGARRCGNRLCSRNRPRYNRLRRSRVKHSQLDFIGVRQCREQPGKRRVHILQALLDELLCFQLRRQSPIPRMNSPRLPFDFEPVAHPLERQPVVPDARSPIYFERANHLASKSLLREIVQKPFHCPYHYRVLPS
jgi:hypothetical protein